MKFGNMNEIIGIGVAVIAEPTLDTLLTKFLPMQSVGGIGIDDLFKAFVLPMLIKKRKGMIGTAVSTIRILALANIVRGFAGSTFNLLTPNATATNTW
jgi:hypothetical protein